MAVFRDESGRRAQALALAGTLGGLVAAAAVVLFLLSVFGATRSQGAPQPRPTVRLPSAGPRAEQRAREAVWRKEDAKLRGLLKAAEDAQRRRKPATGREPVLAAFVVNWDPASLTSLQLHQDRLTHVMPEWIRVRGDGSFGVEEDPSIRAAAGKAELVPTVTNFGDKGFTRELARPILATEAARRDAARRLAAICEERGYAGINLDLEALEPRDWRDFAAFLEAVWTELHPRGYLVTVDVPPEPAGLPADRLAAASDFLIPMAYDEHASTDDPGPIATPRGAAKAAAAWLSRVPAEKLVLALGAYGYDWRLDEDGDAAGPAEEVSFSRALALARENDAAIDWDEDAQSPWFRYDDESPGQREVWFLDAPAMAAQLDALAPFHLRGTAIWRLGAEDPKLFSLFGAPPAPKLYDPAGARPELSGPLPNNPGDVQVVGEGELLLLKSNPQPGERIATFTPEGALQRVEYQSLPSGWILERRGGPPKGRVALSFDDGPDPTWTPKILDALKARGAHAAFFVVGENVEANPSLVRREVAEGHLVGNHTTTHPDLARASALRLELELRVTDRLLEWVSGTRPRLFRPPYHSDESLDEAPNARVIALASGQGYLTLGQDIDPEDFAHKDPREIVERVLAQARKGSVVLLHDGGGDRAATVAALPLLFDALQAQGIAVAEPWEVTGMTRDQLMPPAPSAPADALVAAGDSIVFSGLAAAAATLGPAFTFALGLLGLRAVLLALAAPIQARRSRLALEAAPAAPGNAGLPITVVVPGYNEEKVICRTVESLLAQEPPVAEVVCVDDGSTDRTLAVLRAAFDGNPRVRILTKPNGGKSSALNLGFREAKGELVVALDSDTVFGPETVARLCAPFADPRVAAVAGNAKVGNRVNRLTRWQALEYVTAQNLERRAWDLVGAVPVVPGAVGAWRRSLVLEAGGFHEDTLAEDTDLTLRLIAAGYRVVYAEHALAFTEAPETAKALLKQRFRWTYGVLQACWKHKARLFRPRGGVLGWLILPAFGLYQFAVPLVAPAVDILLVLSVVRGHGLWTAAYYCGFFLIDLLLSAEAILLEGEELGLLRGLFVQRVVYRQLLWVALARSIWTALAGLAVGWGKLARTGSVQAP
jgi:cellulose synthase/poly-beta-1,6-N-acetylglucosamine synthase-like glycosyltransferase/peptidoglycan/xylan/chitin deacetylase (PgdA/CDA1 family)